MEFSIPFNGENISDKLLKDTIIGNEMDNSSLLILFFGLILLAVTGNLPLTHGTAGCAGVLFLLSPFCVAMSIKAAVHYDPITEESQFIRARLPETVMTLT